MSRFDHIREIDRIQEIEKFNPYHDEKGRFAPSPGAAGPNSGNGFSYRRHRSENGMSEFGHAMFADNQASIDGAYGGNAFRVSHKDLVGVDDYIDKIEAKIEEDYDNFSLPPEIDRMIESGTTYREIAESFNPKDIVMSAEAWDNGDLMQWFYDRIAEPNGITGLKTKDGAIVFDPSVIERTDVGKSYDEISEIEKFNPYHGADGRFTSAGAATSFTYAPGKSRAHDLAIQRARERQTEEKPRFTPAKDRREAEQYAREQLGFQKVSYSDQMHMDCVNHINEQITRLQEKYPEVKGAVQELSSMHNIRAYARVTAKYDGTIKLEVSEALYGHGMGSLEQQIGRDIKAGFHPVGLSGGSNIDHEYGHVLAAISTKKKMGVGPADMVAPDKTALYSSVYKASVQEQGWLNKAALDLGKSTKEVQSGISKYAEKNAAETFAEAFSEVMGSKSPRPEAMAVVNASGWMR